MNKEGRQVKSGVHNTKGVIQTNGDVFWPNKFTINVPDHDEQNSSKFSRISSTLARW